MYLMTAHKTFLGYDDAARLIHTSVTDQARPTDFRLHIAGAAQ